MSGGHGDLLDHEYDGIREYDNPTPGWWHLLLWGTIFASICYVLFYHFSVFSSTSRERWAASRDAYFERLFGEIGTLEGDAETILAMAEDDKWMVLAESIFVANCAQCHRGDGGGITGPNLTDDHWLHVEQVDDLFSVITDGVSAKGMPAWNVRLGQNQRVLVAAYVSKLRGTQVSGKAPEGEQIPPWSAAEGDPVARR